MAASTHSEKSTAKAKSRPKQRLRSARVEARRWAALTAWQAGRYLAAAERVPAEVPPSTSMEDLRVYFEDHDHAIAEADYLTASAARLSVLLRSAGVKRKGKNGEEVAVIRGLADHWDPPKQGSVADPSSWFGDGRHLYGAIDTEAVRSAATTLADVLSRQLRESLESA
jgi:hypothetical protein